MSQSSEEDNPPRRRRRINEDIDDRRESLPNLRTHIPFPRSEANPTLPATASMSRERVRTFGQAFDKECDTRLNTLVSNIVKGQVDDSVTASVAKTEAQHQAFALYNELMVIIDERNRELNVRQQQREQEAIASMNEEQAQQIINDNVVMVQRICNAMAKSQERLPRVQRIALTEKIERLITATVTSHDIDEQLKKDSEVIKNNIRGLFNAMITYYAEIASYGYERAPEILTNCSAIIAGAAIIGGSAVSASTTVIGGNVLTMLASYFTTATATATGLYFLQRGGLPITNILQKIGGDTVECLQSGCEQIGSKISSLCKVGLETASGYLSGQIVDNLSDFQIDYDEMSQSFSIKSDSSVSSTSSTISSAESVKSGIESIISVPLEEQINSLLNNTRQIPNEIENVDVPLESQLTQSDFGDIDGGKQRKSRRHMKLKRTRKGRKGRKKRKGHMTKKGRKHHKTLKRYRSKTRS